jgi:hypothetical protein
MLQANESRWRVVPFSVEKDGAASSLPWTDRTAVPRRSQKADAALSARACLAIWFVMAVLAWGAVALVLHAL